MVFGDEFEDGLITYGNIIGKPPFFREEGEGTNMILIQNQIFKNFMFKGLVFIILKWYD